MDFFAVFFFAAGFFFAVFFFAAMCTSQGECADGSGDSRAVKKVLAISFQRATDASTTTAPSKLIKKPPQNA